MLTMYEAMSDDILIQECESSLLKNVMFLKVLFAVRVNATVRHPIVGMVLNLHNFVFPGMPFVYKGAEFFYKSFFSRCIQDDRGRLIHYHVHDQYISLRCEIK
jgi:hypothetical protein